MPFPVLTGPAALSPCSLARATAEYHTACVSFLQCRCSHLHWVLGSQNSLSSASHPHSDPLSYTQKLLLPTATTLSAWRSDVVPLRQPLPDTSPTGLFCNHSLLKPQNRTAAGVPVQRVGSHRAGVLGGGSLGGGP